MDDDLEEERLLTSNPGLAKQREASAVAQEQYRRQLADAKMQSRAAAATKAAADEANAQAEKAAAAAGACARTLR